MEFKYIQYKSYFPKLSTGLLECVVRFYLFYTLYNLLSDLQVKSFLTGTAHDYPFLINWE